MQGRWDGCRLQAVRSLNQRIKLAMDARGDSVVAVRLVEGARPDPPQEMKPQLGYKQASHFSPEFKAWLGVAPGHVGPLSLPPKVAPKTCASSWGQWQRVGVLNSGPVSTRADKTRCGMLL